MALEEFHGPYSSWTQLTASGDTTGASDTSAIQSQFNGLRSGSPVTYLKAGTWYLNINALMGIGSPSGQTVGLLGPMILGHSQSDTIIKFVGSAPAATGASNTSGFLKFNGVTQMRFGRLTLDGNGIAGFGIMDAWDNSNNYFPTGNRFEDLVIKGLKANTGLTGSQSETAGMTLGVRGYGSSEVSIMRVLFNYAGNSFGTGPTVVGVMPHNYNALDIWAWDCQFIGMQDGMTDYTPATNDAGDFCAQRCAFKVTQQDLHVANMGVNYASRWNYASGANGHWRHFSAEALGNFSNNVSIQGCSLSTPAAEHILLGNAGPAGMIDNKVCAHGTGSSATEAVSAISGYGDDNASGEEWGIGNQYADTSAGSYYTSSVTQVHTVDDTYSHTYTDPGMPTMAAEPAATSRTVHEPASSTLGAIQTAINACSSMDVVHIPYGTYTGSTSIEVPANKVIFIEGDGPGTLLQWNGTTDATTPVITFDLPSLCFARDFNIDGNGHVPTVGWSGPSSGGVIHMEGCTNSTVSTTGGLRVNNMGNTAVDLINCTMQTNSTSTTAYGVSSEGTSVVHWVCGTTGNGKGPLYQVLNGGKLVACNVYAENSGGRQTVVVAGSCNGTLSVDGGRVIGDTIACDLSSFTGTATFSNISINANNSTGNNVKMGDNALFLGVTFPPGTAYSTGTATKYAILCPRQNASSGTSVQLSEATGSGVTDTTGFIRTGLSALRNVKPVDLAATVPSNNTQLVLINIRTNNETIAFSGSTTSSGGLPMNYQGTYSATATYAAGDVVRSGGNCLVSLVNNNTGNSPVEGTNFALLGEAALKTLTVTPASFSTYLGATPQLTATGTYDNNLTANLSSVAVWSSSNTSVATVSSSGVVTPVAIGTSNITCTAIDEISSTTSACTVSHTIFSDSFASGDFSKWNGTNNSGTGNSIVITNGTDPDSDNYYASATVTAAVSQYATASAPTLPSNPTSKKLRISSKIRFTALNMGSTGAASFHYLSNSAGSKSALFYLYGTTWILGMTAADGTWVQANMTTQSLTTNTWYTMDVLMDWSGSQTVLKIYINGTLDSTLTDTTTGTQWAAAIPRIGIVTNPNLAPTGTVSADFDVVVVSDQ